MFLKIVVLTVNPPNHPFVHRVWKHYKPSILGYHYFWKHPCNFFGYQSIDWKGFVLLFRCQFYQKGCLKAGSCDVVSKNVSPFNGLTHAMTWRGSHYLGGGFKYMLCSPRKLGKISNLTTPRKLTWIPKIAIFERRYIKKKHNFWYLC